jgi:hypothetical protein
MKVCNCTAIKLPPMNGVCLVCGGEPPKVEPTAKATTFGPGPTGPTGMHYGLWR